jgi:hypothetical protein
VGATEEEEDKMKKKKKKKKKKEEEEEEEEEIIALINVNRMNTFDQLDVGIPAYSWFATLSN